MTKNSIQFNYCGSVSTRDSCAGSHADDPKVEFKVTFIIHAVWAAPISTKSEGDWGHISHLVSHTSRSTG